MTTNDHALLHLVISAPKEPEPKAFEFAHSTKVGDAAHAAALEFGYASGTPSLQTTSDEVLDREKSLAAEHVHDGDHLELVDVGGGV